MTVKLRNTLWTSLTVILTICAVFVVWMWSLSRDMSHRLAQGWFLPPTEFYTGTMSVQLHQALSFKQIQQILLDRDFQQVEAGSRLRPEEFSLWDTSMCQQHLSQELPEDTVSCVALVESVHKGVSVLKIIALSTMSQVTALFEGEPPQSLPYLTFKPVLFAQYYGDKPILRNITKLSEVPFQCLQAVTAIEDSDFLSHSGVSISGTSRALMRNLVSGRYAQGGSTITQQRVKNFFLTPEKTIKRKLTEQAMSLLLEIKFSKDQILENYLNVIYLGQNGPFQVLGYGAASEHYFNKPLSTLNLSECALLAALVNNPGRFNPFNHPETSMTRRNNVLAKMQELNMLSEQEMNDAKLAPLPHRPPRLLSEPAPYYVQAVLKKMDEMQINKDKGLRIFTFLKPLAQEIAQTQLKEEVRRLEKEVKKIAALKEKGKVLQGAFIAIDVRSNTVIALVGGRNFKGSQFNRAVDSHRQVGSIMKPFVYMAALEGLAPNGEPYNATTIISDAPFDHRFDGQRWRPTNYGGKFHGEVPMYVALKESLNVATSRLGVNVGLENVVDLAKRLGIQSPIKPLPSLSLGAFELTPYEVAQAYSAIARMGQYSPTLMFSKVENTEGAVLWENNEKYKQEVSPKVVSQLVGMMKQTIESGTARSIRWRGFSAPTAGKTGTTSDTKDAWFIGFTPEILGLAWVGYDDNTPHGLTGSSGAVPLWTRFMKIYTDPHSTLDFSLFEGAEVETLSSSDQEELLKNSQNVDLPSTEIQLVF
ncbi:MAG: PBP1A family penicillin-binding protein [Bdellovibrionales bacterium]|nr:PBP1A family penicillin-binding protein [Bdellovibrionales bacterium]